MNQWEWITVSAFLLTLLTLIPLRPNLRATLVISRKKDEASTDLPQQLLLSLQVENVGILPVRYTVRNRSEEAVKAQAFITNRQLPLAESIKNSSQPAGIYAERIFDVPLRRRDDDLTSQIVRGYDVEHQLFAGEKTSEVIHIVGNIAMNFSDINYEKALNPYWESFVRVEPAGFWGLPILSKLNKRTIRYTSSMIVVQSVDKIQ